MLSTAETNKKFCWICGKDVDLEQCTTDEHGLSVHKTCQDRHMAVKAAFRVSEQLSRIQTKPEVA